MVEKSWCTKVNRKDDDESFRPGEIDVNDKTCMLWAAFSEGHTSQHMDIRENREERTEGPSPTQRHCTRFSTIRHYEEL